MDFSTINKFSKKFKKKKKNIVSKNAVTSNNFKKVVFNRNVLKSIKNIFYKKINTEITISNQKSSGRCWVFSFLNILKLSMIEKYKLDKDFEFSQIYLYFCDLMEKSFFFLNNILNTKKKKLDSRLLAVLLEYPISDGGQWHMLVNLINKYGLIPKDCMSETYQSNNSGELIDLLNSKLRTNAQEIRNNKYVNIENMMYEIYKILVIFLGEPPKKFDWKYYKNMKNGKKHININGLTPIKFYKKYVPYNVNDKVSIIHAPLKDKEYYKLYNVEYFTNMVDGKLSNYLNLPIDIMKELVVKSINDNEAVWFGCDVAKQMSSKYGLLNDKLYDVKSIIDSEYELNKKYVLSYQQSQLNHAMIFKGYDIDDNKNITQFLVENSWGNKSGIKGDYIMNTNWFNKYVHQIVIDKKYLNSKIKKYLKGKPILCKLWDPFGALAI